MKAKKLRKLLVANRGEIALRVVRVARELGIPTVAVYADQDRGSPHVGAADEAHPLDGTTREQTYLHVGKLLEVARGSGADALHPGYGFLAENPELASACAEAGVLFVGPPSEALRLSGHKLEARSVVERAGVAVLPTHRGPLKSFRKGAELLGAPLLVKAAAGGGGRGIRRVEDPAEVGELARAASREAGASFGDAEVYLEREVPRARHVEFQILADSGGKAVHLFERECSVQRRHQKIVEESPSPALDEKLRSEMASAAVTAAVALGYRNAGTVEFLLELDDRERPVRFYFLELNARIQVEHPVTEAITGEDLVAWQLRLASGERIPGRLDRAPRHGHALECRICAETPPEFLPSAGVLRRLRPPRGPGIRFDEGYVEGNTVPAEFDSLIGKAIAWANDRPGVLARMTAALEEAEILGIDTNLDFLVDVLGHPLFQKGLATTRFVEEEMAGWTPPEPPAEVRAIARAARGRGGRRGVDAGAPGHPGPWEALGTWKP